MDHTSVGGGAGEVDRIRDEQRRRWQAGERVLVEDYLRNQPNLNDSTEAVLDLIFGEYVLREQQGEQPQPADYYRRFPALQARLERLFRLDAALGKAPAASTDPSIAAAADRSTVAPLPGAEELAATTPYVPGVPAGLPRYIGKYPVVSALAQGGQGQVFRAVHPTLGRDVVIKLGRQAVPAAGPDRDQLLREGKLLAELDHPNLVRVYDFDIEGDRPYLVMECVVGRTLEQFARQEKPTAAQAAHLVAQTARALAVVHHRGVSHLDLKPQNLLVDDKGQIRVVDFGLARLERHGHAVEEDPSLRGTVTYMAPEQAHGETNRIGPRSDIYALGGVLYYLLVGQAPHAGRSFMDALEKAAFGGWKPEALRRARVPAALQAICRRAMAREPEERYARVEDLAADLERFVAGPRRRRILAGIGLGILLLGAGLAFLAMRTAPVRPPVTESCLEVKIWRNETYVGLEDALPIHTGDKVRIEAKVPPNLYATLFLRTSEGRLRELAGLHTAAEPGLLTYPEAVDFSAPLEGRAGTELVLLCARRDWAVKASEILPRLAEGETWPVLPTKSVLHLLGNEVRVVKPRDLGTLQRQDDPEGDVRRILLALRQHLKNLDLVEGITFAFGGAPEAPKNSGK